MNIRNLGAWLLAISLLAGLSACGGASKGVSANDKQLDLSDRNLCVREDRKIRCDVSACAEGDTVLAVFGDGRSVPVGTRTEGGEETVEFVDEFLGSFSVVCRGGGDSDTILLAQMDDEDSGGSDTIEPAGDPQNPPPDASVIVPQAPDGGTTETATPPAEDKDSDGVPDASDACPDLAGIKNGCPIYLTVTPEIPVGIAKIIGDLMAADLKAKPREDHFGMVDLSWDTGLAPEDIQEMYLWSAGGFNRLPGETSCGQSDQRFLIVDPETGLNYNQGSPKADAVADLLTGSPCADAGQCEGWIASEPSACRMDLKKKGEWRTKGAVSTFAGTQAAGKYTLVIKTTDGRTFTREAAAGLAAASIALDGNQFVSLDDGHADGLYARIKFKFASLDARSQVVVSESSGVSSKPCENGTVDVPESGGGEVDASCPLQENTSLQVAIPGYGVLHYTIVMGEPYLSIPENLTRIQLLAPKKVTVSYHVSRSWTFSGYSDVNGVKTFETPLSGTFTDNQTLKTLKSAELLCYSYATDSLETCGKPGSSGASFTDVPLDHEHATYKVRIVTHSGKTIESHTFGYLIVTDFEKDETGAPAYLTFDKISVLQCNATPLTCYYSCGDFNTCTTHDLRFDGLSQTFLIKMKHVKSISWKCALGASVTVTTSDGAVVSPGFAPANPYDATVLTATMTSPNTAGMCGLDIQPYYYVDKFSNGQHKELWADMCDSSAYTNTNPDYFSGLALDHCE